MEPLDLVKLTSLLKITSGIPEIGVGLIDGPVAVNHSGFSATTIREVSGKLSNNCTQSDSIACLHGTFVAGILSASRDSMAPAICPQCTLLLRPIFIEDTVRSDQIPSATPEELATAIIESIDAGARVLNLSVALAEPSMKGQQELEEVLDYAVKRDVIVVAAAGNQGTLGSSAIIRHSWVIPVVACDLQGKPINQSNLGSSIAKKGLRAPGENITSLGIDGQPLTLRGTSVATPFVTGAIALLWSAFPTATAAQVKLAIGQVYASRRTSLIPPLLDAWKAYQVIAKNV